MAIIYETRLPAKILDVCECYLAHSAQKCFIDPGNNSPCLSSLYVYEANSGAGYIDELLAVFAIPAWNHGTDTFPTLVNAIERYSLYDYPAIRFAGTVLPRESALWILEMPKTRLNDKTIWQDKTNKIIDQLIMEFAREKQRSVLVRVKFRLFDVNFKV